MTPEAKAAELIGRNAYMLLRKDGWIDYEKVNTEIIAKANAAYYLPLLRNDCKFCQAHDREAVPEWCGSCETRIEIERLESAAKEK